MSEAERISGKWPVHKTYTIQEMYGNQDGLASIYSHGLKRSRLEPIRRFSFTTMSLAMADH